MQSFDHQDASLALGHRHLSERFCLLGFFLKLCFIELQLVVRYWLSLRRMLQRGSLADSPTIPVDSSVVRKDGRDD